MTVSIHAHQFYIYSILVQIFSFCCCLSLWNKIGKYLTISHLQVRSSCPIFTLMVSFHNQKLRQRPIKNVLYTIVWRCSYFSETDTDVNFHWFLCTFYRYLYRSGCWAVWIKDYTRNFLSFHEELSPLVWHVLHFTFYYEVTLKIWIVTLSWALLPCGLSLLVNNITLLKPSFCVLSIETINAKRYLVLDTCMH